MSIYTTITTNIHKYLRKGSGWIIALVIDDAISSSKYNLLAGSTYIQLAKELDHSKKARLMFKTLMIMNALSGAWSDT